MALHLVEQMLSKDPHHRIVIDSALSHPFIQREDKMGHTAVSEEELSFIVRFHKSCASG